jgi:hypothetical protein
MIYFSDEPSRDQGEQDAVGGFEKRVASKQSHWYLVDDAAESFFSSKIGTIL